MAKKKLDCTIWAVCCGLDVFLYGLSYQRTEALDRFLKYHSKTRRDWKLFFRKRGFTLEKVRVRIDAA